jgi:hypothetical protein
LEFRQIITADIAQFDVFEVVPDPFIGIKSAFQNWVGWSGS